MLDIKEKEETIVDDQAAATIQPEQGKLKDAMNQIIKQVPQLVILATTVVASVDPDTIGLPPHTR
jgi:hypothetical protein